MKIRNGFVSNSSSSSFVIIGKKLDSDEKNLLLKFFNVSEEDEWDFYDNCKDIDILSSDGDIYAGKIIAVNGETDYLEDSVTALSSIFDDGKINKLKDIFYMYNVDINLYTGTSYH